MFNCSNCLPTIEESLNNISKYYEGLIVLFGILVAVVVLYLIIKLLKIVYDEKENGK